MILRILLYKNLTVNFKKSISTKLLDKQLDSMLDNINWTGHH